MSKALQEFTRISRYSRYVPKKRRRETWDEQVDRVFDQMHAKKYVKVLDDIWDDYEFAKTAVLNKKVLGSQRALQFGGPAILNKHARMYNCIASFCSYPRMFQEAMWLLLCGCGVGFSVQKHHVAQLPDIAPIKEDQKTTLIIVEDSIEGWADSVGALLSSYFTEDQPFPEYAGKDLVFDFSLIRPKGSPISDMGGTAPGATPLKKSLELIKKLLDRCISQGQTKLRPIDAHDIICNASDAVLAGGIRRSALISVFSSDDEEMVTAKTGNWFIDNPQRGRANNSALLLRKETKKEDFQKIMESVKNFGEPGFVWADSTEIVYNPCCVPGDTWVLTSEGSKQAEDLLDIPFTAIVDGKSYECKTGFFKSGTKQVYKIITDEGFEVRATEDHKIMTADDEWVEIKDLEVGDKINVHDHSSSDCKINTESDDFAKGWILGSLYGNGTFHYPRKSAYLCYWGETRHEMQEMANKYLEQLNMLTSHSKGGCESSCVDVGKITIQNRELFRIAKKYINRGKILTEEVEKESLEFQAGFLRGWFDADGSVQGTQNKGVSIRLVSVGLHALKRAQRMALRLGIYGKIYQERMPEGERMLPDGNGGLKLFHCKATHELIISRSSMKVYQERVGFHESPKTEKLATILSSYKRRPSGSKYVVEITEIVKDEVCDVYDCAVEDIHAFDANGFYVHNCEIALYPVDEKTGEVGFQACNLCEINMKDIKSPEEFYDACRAGAILGTLQAGYTKFEYLSEASQRIIEREALLGVSMTGMCDNPKIAFNPEVLRKGARIVKETNKRIAKQIGINPSARTTCVKPAGSTSCILGTSSGIHPSHSKRYFRRVQINKLEKPGKFFQKHNPDAVEESVWSANKTDNVATFLCETPEDALTKVDVDALQLLKYVKLVQENWVQEGRDVDLCVKPYLQHNVSNTISVKEDEWDAVSDFIYENRENFAGVSLLPASGDKIYKQCPFTSVHTPEELVKMYGDGAMFSSGLIVHALQAFDNDLFDACDAAQERGTPLDIPDFKDQNLKLESQIDALKNLMDKRLFVERAKKFSRRYFGGNIQKMTYCLKDVDGWKKWCDLRRTYVDVPWVDFTEKKNNVKISQTVACSGGKCEIRRM